MLIIKGSAFDNSIINDVAFVSSTSSSTALRSSSASSTTFVLSVVWASDTDPVKLHSDALDAFMAGLPPHVHVVLEWDWLPLLQAL